MGERTEDFFSKEMYKLLEYSTTELRRDIPELVYIQITLLLQLLILNLTTLYTYIGNSPSPLTIGLYLVYIHIFFFFFGVKIPPFTLNKYKKQTMMSQRFFSHFVVWGGGEVKLS